jgi:hypothetical protein
MTTASDTPMTVKIYAADGVTELCEFPYFASLSVLDAYNAIGSFTFNWNLNSPGASNLISDTDLQVAVMMDRRDGSGFVEVWRGFYDQDNYDPSMAESAIVQATGRSIAAILHNAVVYPQAGVGNTTTSWSFTGASPGQIMHDLLVAAQARGCFPLLTWDFTSGQDSSGAAWANGFTYAYAAGTFYDDLIISLAQGGLCDFSMSGTQLHMYNPKTTLATDRSSTVILRRGRDIISNPRGRDRTQIATVMLAQGDSGLNVERTASTLGTLGRRETYLSQSGVNNIGVMDFWADQALGAIDDQQISYTPTYSIDASKGTPIPFKDYFSGNYVSLDVGGVATKYQVNQVAVQCGPGGPTFVQPTLNDVFFSRELLLAKTLNKWGGGTGTVTGPGGPGVPLPGPNPTVPGTPAFVTADVFTAAYFSPATGTTLAQMELQWTTPANTDGTTMIDGYQYIVQYKLSTIPLYPVQWSQLQGKAWSTINGNPWLNPLATPQNTQWSTVLVGIDNNTVIIGGLICGETYDFQIACTDVSGNTGAFSATSAFVAATDAVAPVQPDAPTVAASMVAVQVMSDLGSATGGTYNLARDLDHLEVHFSYDPSFTPVPGVGSVTYLGKLIANAGMMAANIAAVGTFNVTSTTGIYIKLIAVDESGNSSPPSPSSGVTAVLIDDQHISSLSVSKLIAGTVTATIILGGTITTASVGQRVTMDMNGFHAYDALGNQIFSVSSASPLITLGKNAGANSVVLDTSSVYPTFLFNVVGGGNPAFVNAVETASGVTGLGVNMGTYTSVIDSSTVSQRLFMRGQSGIQLGCIDSSQNPFGGGLVVSEESSNYGYWNHGSWVGGLVLNYDTVNSDTSAELDGYLSSTWQPMQAIAAYNNTGIPAAAGVTVSYGVTMYSLPVVFAQYSCGTTGVVGGNISAFSTTGLHFALSGTSPAAWSAFQYAVRVR